MRPGGCRGRHWRRSASRLFLSAGPGYSMDVEKNRRHAMLSWLFVFVLVVLCAALGAIQYRWIGEVSRAEHERLQESLQANLQQIGADFDDAIRSTCLALSPEFPAPD